MSYCDPIITLVRFLMNCKPPYEIEEHLSACYRNHDHGFKGRVYFSCVVRAQEVDCWGEVSQVHGEVYNNPLLLVTRCGGVGGTPQNRGWVHPPQSKAVPPASGISRDIKEG